MKAYRITSTEYRANEPSMFVFADGRYYGDLAYPLRDKMPQDIDHWRTAECADEGRFFAVEDIELDEGQEQVLQRLQTALEVVNSLAVPYTPYRPGMTFAEKEADRKENLRREELNRPFDRTAAAIVRLRDKVISSL